MSTPPIESGQTPVLSPQDPLSRREFEKLSLLTFATALGLDRLFKSVERTQKMGLLEQVRLLNSLAIDPDSVEVKLNVNDRWQANKLNLSFNSANLDLIPAEQRRLNSNPRAAKVNISVDITNQDNLKWQKLFHEAKTFFQRGTQIINALKNDDVKSALIFASIANRKLLLAPVFLLAAGLACELPGTQTPPETIATLESLFTPTPKPTKESYQPPELQPTPQPTIEITSIPFNFEVGTWAENEDGTFNAQKMFPLVGAVDKKHHQTAPLTYNALNIALVTQDDIAEKNLDQRQQLIANQAVLINDNIKLKNELDRINQAIVKLTQDTSKRWIKPEYFYVVIERNTESGLYQISQIVFDDFGEITRYKPVDENSDFILLPKEEEPQLLPELYVDGPYIKRADTGEILQLQGITLDRGSIRDVTFEWDDINIAISLLKTAKSWGTNFVRMQYVTGLVRSNIEDFKKLTREAELNGMYIMFSPSSKSGPYNDVSLPDDQMIDDIAYLAEQLKPYTNVLLDVFNEPYNVSDQNLYNTNVKAINKIREKNLGVLIGIPGNKWSRDFRYLKEREFNYSNILFRINYDPYVNWTNGTNFSSIEDPLSWWEFLLDENKKSMGPIMIGEFRYPIERYEVNDSNEWQEWMEREKLWQEKVFELISEKGLSFTQYGVIDTYDNWIFNTNIPNLPSGLRTKSFLENTPPMQFDQ